MPIDVDEIQKAQAGVAEAVRRLADALEAGELESCVMIAIWPVGNPRGWSSCGYIPPEDAMADLKLRGALHTTLFEQEAGALVHMSHVSREDSEGL